MVVVSQVVIASAKILQSIVGAMEPALTILSLATTRKSDIKTWPPSRTNLEEVPVFVTRRSENLPMSISGLI